MTITIPVQFDGDFTKLNAELQSEMRKVGNKVGSNLNTGINKSGSSLESSGRKASSRFGGVFSKGMSGLGAATGVLLGGSLVTGFVASSISAFASFEQNLNLTEKALGATGKEMEKLSSLAKKLGAETVFSAGEASEAMLELAKAGFSTRQVMQTLPQVMNLAATEGLALADASNAVTSAMSQFGIEAKDSSVIVNALAGASNASSASVSGLANSLSLVGSAAAATGLTVPQATGALAALADNGLKGSIAGTSLASVLNHLVPTTEKASGAMKRLGLDFTNADGSFKSIFEIAGELQGAFKKLSAEKRTLAIGAIFGRDASNIAAVNALIATGEKGLRQYTKASKDDNAAQKLADARMKGVAGALERLSGAWDTLKISVGEALSPLVVKAADALGNGLGDSAEKIGPAIEALGPIFSDLGKAIGPIFEDLKPAISDIAEVFKNDLLPAFEEALPIIKPIAAFLIDMFAGALVGAIKGFANVVSGVFTVIGGIFKVFSGILTGDWSKAWQGLKDIMGGALKAILGAIQVWWNLGILAIFKKGIVFLTHDLWVSLWKGLQNGAKSGLGLIKNLIGSALRGIRDIFVNILKGIQVIFSAAFHGYISLWRGLFDLIKSLVSAGVSRVVGLIKGIPGAILGLGGKMLQAGKDLIGKLFEGIKNAVTGGIGFVRSIASALTSAINDALNLPLEINFDKGPIHIHATLIPAFPEFAKGTNFAPGGLALVGERGPELVTLPRGSRVDTAQKTQQILSQQAPNITFENNFFGPTTSSGRRREIEWLLAFGTGLTPAEAARR